jgi:hypothetical protein
MNDLYKYQQNTEMLKTEYQQKSLLPKILYCSILVHFSLSINSNGTIAVEYKLVLTTENLTTSDFISLPHVLLLL